MSNQDSSISVRIDMSTAGALDRSERTLRHALAAVLFAQVSHQFQSGLMTVSEAYSKISDESLRLPALQPGDIDPMCGLKVPTPEKYSADLDASFKKLEACRANEDPGDEDNWVAVKVIRSDCNVNGADMPVSTVVDSDGNEFYADSNHLRKVPPKVMKAPFVATHEVHDSDRGWIHCCLIGSNPIGIEVQMPDGSVVCGLPASDVRAIHCRTY